MIVVTPGGVSQAPPGSFTHVRSRGDPDPALATQDVPRFLPALIGLPLDAGRSFLCEGGDELLGRRPGIPSRKAHLPET